MGLLLRLSAQRQSEQSFLTNTVRLCRCTRRSHRLEEAHAFILRFSPSLYTLRSIVDERQDDFGGLRLKAGRNQRTEGGLRLQLDVGWFLSAVRV